MKRLEEIENQTNGVGREYPLLSTENTEWLINRVKELTEVLKLASNNIGDYNGDYSTEEDYRNWDNIQARIEKALEEK